MSVSDAGSRDSASPVPLDHAQALLKEALALIDGHADAPDIGARLQEVIDALGDLTG